MIATSPKNKTYKGSLITILKGLDVMSQQKTILQGGFLQGGTMLDTVKKPGPIRMMRNKFAGLNTLRTVQPEGLGVYLVCEETKTAIELSNPAVFWLVYQQFLGHAAVSWPGHEGDPNWPKPDKSITAAEFASYKVLGGILSHQL